VTPDFFCSLIIELSREQKIQAQTYLVREQNNQPTRPGSVFLLGVGKGQVSKKIKMDNWYVPITLLASVGFFIMAASAVSNAHSAELARLIEVGKHSDMEIIAKTVSGDVSRSLIDDSELFQHLNNKDRNKTGRKNNPKFSPTDRL
jgi:uncharacterized protein YpbB